LILPDEVYRWTNLETSGSTDSLAAKRYDAAIGGFIST
jgi:hypothetical protein